MSSAQYIECSGVYDAGDKVMDYVDALDTEGMTIDTVRARIYGFALRLRPARHAPRTKQSRIDSAMETVTNTVIGLLLSLITWHFVAMAFGIPMPLDTNLAITAIFTVVSLARQYVVRRAFNGRTAWAALKSAIS